MAWDALAIRVGIHSLAVPESSMDYGAINPSDPISIGIFQWYATRAAKLLNRVKKENPTAFAKMPGSIQSDVNNYNADNSSFWTSRYVSSGERDALASALRDTKAIQDDQARIDMADYKNVAIQNGIDVENNTKTALFFANMYNQGPKYALQVLRACTYKATLDQIYAACLNNGVLGQYKNRYDTAYQIINTMDPGPVGQLTESPDTDPPAQNGTPEAQAPSYADGGKISHAIQKTPDLIHLVGANGTVTALMRAPGGMWVPQGGIAATADDTPATSPQTPVPDPTPDPNTGTPPGGAEAPVNDYPYRNTSPYYHIASDFTFWMRECTDFCAWRIRSRDNIPKFGNGWKGVVFYNAYNWDNACFSAGVRVDTKPAVGAIAQRNSGTYGHVAYINAVYADGTFSTEEYNTLNDHAYHYIQHNSMDNFDNILHFEDFR